MPIAFNCPNCGRETEGVNPYASRDGHCRECGVPFSTPVSSPAADLAGAPSQENSSAPTAVKVAVRLGLFVLCGGVLVALLLPAQRGAREAARRSQCSNNLKQIGLALQAYHDAYQSFPPAFIADADGQPMHSWRVLILPFLEHRDLYDRYDFNEPWDGPSNRQLASLMPAAYACPSGPNEPASGITSYAVVVGPDTLFNGPDGYSFADVPDGSSRTIAVVEAVQAGLNWMEPNDLDLARMSFKINGAAGISSPHPAGAQAVLADGSVMMLLGDSPEQTVRAHLTRSGGEPVPPSF